MKSKRINVGQQIVDSLTADQIARLLEVVAPAGDLDRYMDEFKKTDPDMAVRWLMMLWIGMKLKKLS